MYVRMLVRASVRMICSTISPGAREVLHGSTILQRAPAVNFSQSTSLQRALKTRDVSVGRVHIVALVFVFAFCLFVCVCEREKGNLSMCACSPLCSRVYACLLGEHKHTEV